MLNQSGIKKQTLTSPTQILASINMQYSVGIVVSAEGGVESESKKVVKAGTPLKADFSNLATPAKAATEDGMNNVVLLHDVDVTDGDANGTGLVMGVVNWNRLESDVQALLKAGDTVSGVFCIAL